MTENFSAPKQGAILYDRLMQDAEQDQPFSVDNILVYLIEQDVLDVDDKFEVVDRAIDRCHLRLTVQETTAYQKLREIRRLQVSTVLLLAMGQIIEQGVEQDEAQKRQDQQWHNHRQALAQAYSSEDWDAQYAEHRRWMTEEDDWTDEQVESDPASADEM